MIESFDCKETEKIWNGIFSKKLPHDIQKIALQKLRILNNASVLKDLKIPLSNHLEALKGKKDKLYSIRINDQWRICFSWKHGKAENIVIVDYH